MSPTWGETAGIVGIHNVWIIGVDLARGVTMLVAPGRSVIIGRLQYGKHILQRGGSKLGLYSGFFISYSLTHT